MTRLPSRSYLFRFGGSVNRRDFLKVSAGSLGGAALATTLALAPARKAAAANQRAWPDGKPTGPTYSTGAPFCLFPNEKVLGAAGYTPTANEADYPQTWDDVYKQAVDIKKKKIVETPILPAWYKAWTGTPWA